MKHTSKRFSVKRFILATAILSMAAVLSGCGSSSNKDANDNGVGGYSNGLGATGSNCLAQPISFSGTGYFDGINILAGNVPLNVPYGVYYGTGAGQSFGQLGGGANSGGALSATSIDGVIRFNLNPNGYKQAAMSGTIQLSGDTQNLIRNYALAGVFSGGQPLANPCVSAVAINGAMNGTMPYGVQVFLYINGTQSWYHAIFSNH